jgi:ABC-type thiamine transport system ATPase subunit
LDQVFSFMPQNAALLNATIFENLFLGDDGKTGPGDLAASDLDLIERSSLGHLCRLKALEMTPGDQLLAPDQAGELAALVKKARTYFHHGPPGDGYFSRDLWLLEILLAGKCERSQALDLLIGGGQCREIRVLDHTPLAARLVDWGQKMLQCEKPLLELPNFYLYSQMAKTAIDERVWQLRVRCAGLLGHNSLAPEEQWAFYMIALTATPADLGIDNLLHDWSSSGAFRQGHALETDYLKQVLGPSWRPFHPQEINPYLSWRENLAFGAQDRLADASLLAFIDGEGRRDLFTWLGMQYGIGRQGGNLSGGQGQLVALCRTLLRRTPVVILDEPTSSLDPLSKIQIAKLLQAYKPGHIIITVSHDQEFVSLADAVILMDGGRIAAWGTFQEVAGKSALLGQTRRDS